MLVLLLLQLQHCRRGMVVCHGDGQYISDYRAERRRSRREEGEVVVSPRFVQLAAAEVGCNAIRTMEEGRLAHSKYDDAQQESMGDARRECKLG